MIRFTDGQSKAIATGITVLALALVVAFVGSIAWMVLKILPLIMPAIMPVILGFFLALFFRPVYRSFQRFLHNPTLAVAAMLVALTIPIGIFLWFGGAMLIDQALALIAKGPELVKTVSVWLQTTFPKLHGLLGELGFPTVQDMGVFYTQFGPKVVKIGMGALKYLSAVVTIVVTLIFFLFFLTTKERKGSEVFAHVPFLKKETQAFLGVQVDSFFDILVNFFQRQALICLIEGAYYGLGFMAVGLPYGFLIGFALGCLNLIPLFGSVVCLPMALPIAYFDGGSLTRLVLVLVVWGIGQFLDGYFITPKIQGNKTGLGYAGVIFSFVFWANLLGPVLGMLLAIPLSAFCVVLWRTVKARFIRPVV